MQTTPKLSLAFPRLQGFGAHRHLQRSKSKVEIQHHLRFCITLMSQFSENLTVDTTPVTTTFIHDGPAKETRFQSGQDTGALPVIEQGIRDFLRKPQLLDTVTWATSDLFEATLYSVQPSTTLTSVAVWANKIEGYTMVRGRPCLTVMHNATPFQAGKLIAHFVPANAGAVNYIATMCQCTQHPNQELDCRDPAIDLEVPYIAPTDWFAIDDSGLSCPWGTFYLDVLSPLSVGVSAEDSVNVSIFLHWEDFELAGPIVPQSGVRRQKYQTIEEAEAATGLKLSDGLRTVAKASSTLGEIPMLAPVAIPVSWAADAAAAIASFFGFSKPARDPPTDVNARIAARHTHSCDGDFVGPRLALRQDNRLQILDNISIRKEDEMSFEFLKSVSCYVGRFSWSVSDSAGDNLYQTGLGPRSHSQTYTQTRNSKVLTMKAAHPVHYLARFFRHFRGSIRLTFKFVKTQFHTGRVQVSFTPLRSPVTLPSVSTGTLALRQIVDLTVNDEVTIDFPFMQPLAYLKTDEYMGIVKVDVLNELRAPETVADNMDVLVYISFGKDFELQAPHNVPSGASMIPITIESGEWQPEGVHEPLGGHGTGAPSTEYSVRAQGEHFSSVRQLLVRFSNFYTNSAPQASGARIWPWFIGFARQDNTTGSLVSQGVLGGDIFSYLTPMYAFYRGGVRLMIKPGLTGYTMQYNNGSDIVPGTSSIYATAGTNLTNVGSTVWLPGGTANAGFGGNTFTDSDVGLILAEIPFQSECRMAYVDFSLLSGHNVVPLGPDQPVGSLQFQANSGLTYGSLAMSRAIAEDFQLSYFICAPLEYVSLV